jgi:hypothetical protein
LRIAKISFGLSLFVLVLSLGYSLYEIAILEDLGKAREPRRP